jgi:hypothetical protein
MAMPVNISLNFPAYEHVITTMTVTLTDVLFQMTTSSYSSVHQPFSMPHSATNMAPVSGLRQDAMGKLHVQTIVLSAA